jgi:thiamine biosynthesis lipoprotein
VGIADPHRPGELLATIHSSDLAVATSGIAERGAHVLDPRRGAPAIELASVTVIGPSLSLADAYATAAVAMGTPALEWLETMDGYEALLVDAGGDVRWTPGFP